jgi:hypothetical protein
MGRLYVTTSDIALLIKDSRNPAVKTPNHVLHHPSEQVRQNNHRMV